MRWSAGAALALPGAAARRSMAASRGPVTLYGAIVLLAVAATLAVPVPHADAHALLRRADPENGATLERPPQAITLAFTEDPEPAFSSIRVLNTSGRQVSQGSPRSVAGLPNTLRLPLPALPAGVYTVNWRTVSRIDGHVTGGALAFGIGVTPTSTPASDTEGPPPSLLAAVARWLFYAGLSGLVGFAWVWTQALPGAAEGSWRAPWLAWGAAALGVIGLEETQRAAAGADFALFLSSWLGWTMAWRAVFVLGAAAALLVGARLEGAQRRSALIAAGGCAVLAVLAHVGAGHAAAAATWRWARVAIQWLHVSAIGAWLGGLAALLIAVGHTPTEDRAAAVRRFSTIAGILLAVVIATGATQAIQEVGAWGRLFTTPYGRLVLLKIGLLAALVILGWANRHRNVPQAAQTLQGLRRIGTWEVAVAAVALAVTAFLTQTAPASLSTGTGGGDAGGVASTGSDFATSMRARLQVSPGYPGLNRFTLTLRDYDTGLPVVADRVTLRLRSAGRPDLAPSTLMMTRQRRDQTYRAQGTNLSLDGRWIVVAVVERGVTSVEVPLVVNLRSQPLKVRTIEAPGQPTLYSVELPGGVVLDSYLDPGRPGFNEVHVTFINVGGQELPVPGLAAIVASKRGSGRLVLPVRRFGPGHFIADATLSQGTWNIEVTAATADGQVLKARFTVRV
jgi:copper transport protein